MGPTITDLHLEYMSFTDVLQGNCLVVNEERISAFGNNLLQCYINMSDECDMSSIDQASDRPTFARPTNSLMRKLYAKLPRTDNTTERGRHGRKNP